MTRWQIAALVAFVVALIASFFLFVAPDWLYHPLGYCAGTPVEIRDCKGYNSWSGSFSDVTELTDLAAVLITVFSVWMHTRCDSPGCLRKGKYKTANGHHRQCRVCHPDLPDHKLSKTEIHELHHAFKRNPLAGLDDDLRQLADLPPSTEARQFARRLGQRLNGER